MPRSSSAHHPWLVPAAVMVLLGTAVPGYAARITGVGTLPGTEACFPMAISPDGAVAVGTCRDLSLRPVPMAFSWTRDRGLAHLSDTLPSNARPISANAVSPSGDTIVGSTVDIGRGNEGYVWVRDRPITGLGNAEGSSIPTAVAMGVVVGTLDTPKGARPFRWTANDGLRLHPPLASGIQAEVYGISSDGKVIIGRAWWTGSQRDRGWALRWSERDGLVNLEPPRNDDYLVGSTATAVSGDGLVVVGDNIFDGRRNAFRWTSDRGMVRLGILPGDKASEARAVTGDGGIVVGQSGSRPFWWDSGHGLRDLRTMLETDYGMAPSLRGWQLETVTGISADGRVLVGQGRNPAGEAEGWIIDLR